VINWTPATLVARLGGDRTLARELVNIFLSEYPRLISTLDGAVNGNNPIEIRRAAHALKGTVSNFMDDGPTATARAIEEAAAASPVYALTPMLTQLRQEIEELAAAMRRQIDVL
jgi:HPt (histidine-containing phosphotransfer) domain-containing protein